MGRQEQEGKYDIPNATTTGPNFATWHLGVLDELAARGANVSFTVEADVKDKDAVNHHRCTPTGRRQK